MRGVHALGEHARLVEVGSPRLAPQDVGDRTVRLRTRDGRLDPVADAVEALLRPLAVGERAVAFVHVGGEERGGEGVGARHEDRRDVQDVGGQSRRGQRPEELRGRDQDLAAQVPALLLGGELVLEVDAGGAALDHRGHHLEGVERAAEARLGVGHDRQEEVCVTSLGPRDLVGALERVVDPLDDRRHRVRGVQRLVGVGVPGEVRVGGDLPAGHVDRLEAGLGTLDGLVPGEAAERRDVVAARDQVPELRCRRLRERMVVPDPPAEPYDLFGRVGTGDRGPAWVGVPALLELGGFGGDLLLDGGHVGPFRCSRGDGGGERNDPPEGGSAA